MRMWTEDDGGVWTSNDGLRIDGSPGHYFATNGDSSLVEGQTADEAMGIADGHWPYIQTRDDTVDLYPTGREIVVTLYRDRFEVDGDLTDDEISRLALVAAWLWMRAGREPKDLLKSLVGTP